MYKLGNDKTPAVFRNILKNSNIKILRISTKLILVLENAL